MMRARPVLTFAIAAALSAATLLAAAPAQARCKLWTASHNGTDLFYPNEGGAAGTAANTLIWEVEQWKKRKDIKHVRIGKIRTQCGDWFMKYMLPHKHCIAKAQVCY